MASCSPRRCVAPGRSGSRGRRPEAPAVAAAFDALRFGRENTLDLRSHLPTGAEATRRADAFLRERQVAGAAEVLVITGRGNQSVDGIAVVRPAVAALLARLRRRGVVSRWREHTPGSFVVTPASVRVLLASPRRRGDGAEPPVSDPVLLAALDAPARAALRRLAERSLQLLGAPTADAFVQDEMLRQFSVLGAALPPSADRDDRLRETADRALRELDGME